MVLEKRFGFFKEVIMMGSKIEINVFGRRKKGPLHSPRILVNKSTGIAFFMFPGKDTDDYLEKYKIRYRSGSFEKFVKKNVLVLEKRNARAVELV